MVQVHPQHRVAFLQDGFIDGDVGLRARVGLDVGVLGAEELLGALACQRLDHVGVLAAAVVAASGVAFGVLVGKDRAGGFQHRLAGEVFRGDQLQGFDLAADFVLHRLVHIGINFAQRALKVSGG